MKLGISGQLLGETMNLEEIMEIFKKYDVTNMEIWPNNIPCTDKNNSVSWTKYEGRDILRAKEILKEHGVNAVCVTMPGAFDKEISSNMEEYAAALRYTVEVAKELGASFVNHYCYYLCLDQSPDIGRLMKYMKPAMELAESEGIIMCLENEAHDATRTPKGMLKIIDSFGSGSFKTNFDAVNYYHAGQEGFPRAYDILKKHIAYIHLKNGCLFNAQAGHSDKSKGTPMTGAFSSNIIYYPTIPKGAVNIDGLLIRLKEDGYDGYCVLEPHTTVDWAEKYFKEETGYLRSRGFFA